MGGVAAEVAPGGKDLDGQPAVLPLRRPAAAGEGEQGAVDVAGDGPGQLQRVPFATAVEAVRTEGGRGDVDDPHARSLARDPGLAVTADRRLPVPPADGRRRP